MAQKQEIQAVRSELDAWLDRQPDYVRIVGFVVTCHLDAALIGARPSPVIVAMLADDVERLARAKADASQLLCD